MESNHGMRPGLGNESPVTPPAASMLTHSSGNESGTLDHAKEKARDIASDAKGKVVGELRTRADSTRSSAADTLGSVANALTSSAQQLRNGEQSAPLEYVQRAGDQLQRASNYLRNTSTDELIRNSEALARRQPAAFLAGAFVIGFLAARLVKSSQSPDTGGTSPQDRSLASQSSRWTGDRETPVSGFREPAGASVSDDPNPGYPGQFGRDMP